MRIASVGLAAVGGVLAVAGAAVAVGMSFLEQHIYLLQPNATAVEFLEIEAMWRWYVMLGALSPALLLGGLLMVVVALALAALRRPHPVASSRANAARRSAEGG